MIPLDAIPSQAANGIERELDQETVVVFPSLGQVKVLNEVGAAIWRLADGTRSVRQIVQLICQEYQVESTQAEHDACEFLDLLVERGLIALSNGVAPEPLAGNGR